MVLFLLSCSVLKRDTLLPGVLGAVAGSVWITMLAARRYARSQISLRRSISQDQVELKKKKKNPVNEVVTSGALTFTGGEANKVGALSLHPGNKLTIWVTSCYSQAWRFWVVAFCIVVV